jgi:hypothetical protein
MSLSNGEGALMYPNSDTNPYAPNPSRDNRSLTIQPVHLRPVNLHIDVVRHVANRPITKRNVRIRSDPLSLDLESRNPVVSLSH